MSDDIINLERIRPRHRWTRRALAWMAVKAARLLVRLPKRVLLLGLPIVRFFYRLLHMGGELGTLPLDDIEWLLRHDPRGWDALRRMFLNSRDAQFRAFVEGVLEHHFRARAAPAITSRQSKRGVARRRVRGRPFRIALLGDSHDLEQLRQAYRRRPDVELVAHDDEPYDQPAATTGQPEEKGKLATDHADRTGWLDGLDGLEVGGPGPLDEDLLSTALNRGIALSIHSTSLDSPERLQRLIREGERARNPVRLFYPILYYPPVHVAKQLLVAGEIGEVCAVRIRATLGSGGTAPVIELPDRERYLAHPAFDQFLLLLYLGGPVERVTAYLNPMDPHGGGQGLIACKHSYPGRYGLIDLSFAPGLSLPSRHLPYDLEAEIAGSDGIIWLRRGMAERTQEAPVRVRVGRKAYSIGVESGLETRWDSVYQRAADHLVERWRSIAHHLVEPQHGVDALRLRAASYQAAASSQVVTVGELLH